MEFDNPLSKNVRTLLSMIRKERNSYMKVGLLDKKILFDLINRIFS